MIWERVVRVLNRREERVTQGERREDEMIRRRGGEGDGLRRTLLPRMELFLQSQANSSSETITDRTCYFVKTRDWNQTTELPRAAVAGFGSRCHCLPRHQWQEGERLQQQEPESWERSRGSNKRWHWCSAGEDPVASSFWRTITHHSFLANRFFSCQWETMAFGYVLDCEFHPNLLDDSLSSHLLRNSVEFIFGSCRRNKEHIVIPF